VTKEVQALFTLVHAQFALTNSLLQYVLTCMVEPPEEVLPAARARAKLRYTKILHLAAQGGSDTEQSYAGGGPQFWEATMRKDHCADAPGDQTEAGKRGRPHPLVEACVRVEYISYRMNRCGSAIAGAPLKDVGAACGNP
jgi:hypothetical protein